MGKVAVSTRKELQARLARSRGLRALSREIGITAGLIQHILKREPVSAAAHARVRVALGMPPRDYRDLWAHPVKTLAGMVRYRQEYNPDAPAQSATK
jgi:hypothetical protein